MLGLPKSTEFNRRVPKQKFYEKIDVPPALKRVFIESIQSICWRNKIASATVNLAPGKAVTEIEVFEIKLTVKAPPEQVLRQIDKAVPYHILFLLEYQGKYQAWAAYKELSTGVNAFKLYSYYHTGWMLEEELPLKLEGLNIDEVYEGFVRQIGGPALAGRSGEALRQTVERDLRRQDLQRRMTALQATCLLETPKPPWIETRS